MNFSEDVKYYLKILYYEYVPQHHAKKNEESGEAQRERDALMRSRCSEVPHKMSFREDVAARKISHFSAVLAPQHARVSRKKKKETFSLLSSLSHLFELLLLRSRFPSLLIPRGVRVGGRVFLFVRRTVCVIRSGARAKGTTTTRQKGKEVQDVEDQEDVIIKDGQRGFEHDDVVQKGLRHSLRQSRHARGHARPRLRGENDDFIQTPHRGSPLDGPDAWI